LWIAGAVFLVLASPSTMLGLVKLTGESMIPTLNLQDLAAVNKAAFSLKAPFTN
jgi:hypothetical protein